MPPSTAPQTRIPKRPLANTLLLLALWIVFYASFTLFRPALLDDADSVHAEVAREMLLRHDWVTLYANGIRYLEKAPLLYWSMAASFKLFGSQRRRAPAFRSRSTVLALAFAVESFARRAFRSARAGLYAALILLSSFGIFPLHPHHHSRRDALPLAHPRPALLLADGTTHSNPSLNLSS